MYRSNIIFLACYGLWIAGIVLILGASTSSCKSSGSAVSAEVLEDMDRFLDTRDFRMDAEFVMPTPSRALAGTAATGYGQIRGSSATNLNVQGEGYFIAIKGDSAFTQLPYFGSLENMTSYNTANAGINVQGLMEDFKIKPRKKGREVSFYVKKGFERFRFLMAVTPSLKTDVSVFSPQRDVIRYSGTLKKGGE